MLDASRVARWYPLGENAIPNTGLADVSRHSTGARSPNEYMWSYPVCEPRANR